MNSGHTGGFGTIKTEYEMTEYENIESARREIATYIAYYKNARGHLSLDYLTPTQFEPPKHACRH